MAGGAHPESSNAAPEAKAASLSARWIGRRPRSFRTVLGTPRDRSRVGRSSAGILSEGRGRARAAGAMGGRSCEHGDGMIAHAGTIPPAFSPVRLLTGWSLSPLPLVLTLAAGILYALGLRRLSRPGARGPRFPTGR